MSGRTLAVAVTGGIAGGKSEVVDVFKKSGALVISADVEARSILAADRSVRHDIIRLLGEKAYTAGGRVNRSYIAERIFTKPSLRRGVNSIVHPAVSRRVARTIAAEKKKGKRRLLVVEAALIFEARMEKMFDVVIVVDTPQEKRVARIRRRDGLTRREAIARIRAQGSNRKKAALADFVITNNGDLRTLRRTARFVCRLLTGIAHLS